MIRYEPIPLLEATLFLANWAAQISWNTDIEKTFGFCSKSTKQTLEEYSHILTELERRLAAGITVPESTVQTLFAPLHPSDKKANHPSLPLAAAGRGGSLRRMGGGCFFS